MNAGGKVNQKLLRLLLSPALIVAVGLAVLSGTSALNGPKGEKLLPGMVLASTGCTGPSFCITGPAPGPILYPGATASKLPLTFSNPLNVPIRVFSLTVSFVNSFPTGCASAALQVNGMGVTGSTPTVVVKFASPSFAVPAGSGSSPGVATYPATLALADTHARQDSCKSLALSMNYTASAYYTVPTNTVLVASPSPATVGQPVSLKATVSPTVTPSSAGSAPVGSVQFFQCAAATSASTCTTPIGSPVPVNSSGVAVTNTSFSSQGSYYLEAVFTPTDSTNFGGSTAGIVTEPAGYTTCITNNRSGSFTISSGQTDCITTTGKVLGNVTVSGGGRLDMLGGTVSGNITINSSGGLNVTSGSVSGNINSTGATYFNLCGLNLAGNVSASSSSSWVQVGDSDSTSNPKCTGNTISGGITVSGSTVGADVGGNAVSGGVTITNTSGALEIEKNKISGGLSCAGNAPAPSDDSQPNSVGGKRSGQCSAGGF